MARMEVTMNDIVEVFYKRHQGAGLKAISGSQRFDRKTVRKYVQLACIHLAKQKQIGGVTSLPRTNLLQESSGAVDERFAA